MSGAVRRRGRPGHDLDAVIAAGVAVFTERGYDAATMDDVAACLGIAKSSLYHHVSGKEEILQRALDSALTALEAVLEEAGGRDETAVLRLMRIVRAAVATLIAELPSVTLLLRVRGNSAAERAALERRRRLDGRFAELIRLAVADGSLRADIDPQLAARLVFGTINSITEWYRPADPPTDAAALGAAVSAIILDGLRHQPAALPVTGAPPWSPAGPGLAATAAVGDIRSRAVPAE